MAIKIDKAIIVTVIGCASILGGLGMATYAANAQIIISKSFARVGNNL